MLATEVRVTYLDDGEAFLWDVFCDIDLILEARSAHVGPCRQSPSLPMNIDIIILSKLVVLI